MNSDQLGGILRAVLAAVGGYVTGKGYVDSATYLTISGAIVTVLTAVWSFVSNRSGKTIA